ncbi:trypsin-like peptidase domain-containing protein [Streptomyces sp. NPDC049879]|uniref:trypsin-like peptidase domain-containing protein n=1 Tax=Streptomyces sp. NPDC049879 TaxID=3365598 RepID=UPI00378D176B
MTRSTASADGGGGNGLAAARVAEVVAVRAGGGSARGSGYLVAPGRVLTAAHVVPPGATAVTVRFDADLPGERTAAATVAWRHAGLDIAVLAHPPDAAEAGLAPAVPGRVGDTDAEVPFSALGFPLLALRRDGSGRRYRDSHQLAATLLPLSNRREGTFDLGARPVARDLSGGPGDSAWEGMSGAPVFSRGLLIGVVVAAHRSPGEERLTATRVDRWAERLREEPEPLAALQELLGTDLAPSALPDAAARTAAMPDTLADPPPPPAVFGFRDEELATVLDTLRPGPGHALAVTGPAGVGKTSLTAQAAHEARREGWFPGGFLYADLRGHRPEEPGGNGPLTAEATLLTLLRTLLPGGGTGGGWEAYNLSGLAALYRDALRERGDRRGPVLVLLDNAPPGFPVRLFMPGDGPHRLLLTARTARDWPAALPLLRLGPLARDASRALLTALLRGARVPLDGITEDDLAEIAAACEDLPLPLAMAAGRLRDDAGHGAGPLLAVLRQRRERLSELDMHRVYAATYEALDAEAARLFRLLALHPGGAFGGWSAAALLGVPDAGGVLRRLHRAELLQRADGEGRFRLHDLLRAYADELLAGGSEEERAAALGRLLTRAGELAASADAAWLAREEDALLALTGTAAETGAFAHVETLGPPLAAHFLRRARHREAILVRRHLITAAQHRRDRLAEAGLFVELAEQYFGLDNLAHAVACRQAALTLFRRAGSFPRHMMEGNAIVAQRVGRWADALSHFRWAAREAEQRRDDARLVRALIGLGDSHRALGRPAEAVAAWRRAAEIAERGGDTGGLAQALTRQARLWHDADDPGRAEQWARAALDHARRSGDVRRTVDALRTLLDVLASPDGSEEAGRLLDEALSLARAHHLPADQAGLLAVEATWREARGRAGEARRLRDERAALTANLQAPPDLPAPPPASPPASPPALDRRSLLRVFVLPGLWIAWTLGVTVLLAVDGYAGEAVAWGCYLTVVSLLSWDNHRSWSTATEGDTPWWRLPLAGCLVVSQLAVMAVDERNLLVLPSLLCFCTVPFLWRSDVVTPWGLRARLRRRLGR